MLMLQSIDKVAIKPDIKDTLYYFTGCKHQNSRHNLPNLHFNIRTEKYSLLLVKFLSDILYKSPTIIA